MEAWGVGNFGYCYDGDEMLLVADYMYHIMKILKKEEAIIACRKRAFLFYFF